MWWVFAFLVRHALDGTRPDLLNWGSLLWVVQVFNSGLYGGFAPRESLSVRQREGMARGGTHMVGKLHRDFRSGNLNEELGVLLLKGVAAVATVPRPEDVGIDAVATLLREGPDDSLIAENSFYVQFKSSVDRKVQYPEHGVRWLESLKLPFFIGSVRKAKCEIDLYATHRLSQALLEGQYGEVELVLDPTNEVHFGIDPKTEAMTEQYRRVNIGPPLLTWSTFDLAKPEFAHRGYSVLKPYLEAEQRNIDYRGIRYIEVISWETDKPPRCAQARMHYQSSVSAEDILRVFLSMAPHLQALSTRAWITRDRTAFEIVLRLVEYMRGSGFDPDPNKIYDSSYENWDQLAFPGELTNHSS